MNAETVMSPPMIAPRRIRAALLAVAAALAVVVAAAMSAQASLAELNAMADQRGRVRTNLLRSAHFLSLLKDLETGQRGFVITGREEFLVPYSEANAAIPRDFATLRGALAADSPPGFSWDDLDTHIRKRQELAARAVSDRRTLGSHAIDETDVFTEGKAAMDIIRDRFAALDHYQEQRLADLNGAVGELRRRARLVAWTASLLTIGLALTAIILFLRERVRRQALEDSLRDANQTLEERVAARTAELSAAHDRIAGFAAELDRSVEAERRRLAREVHDQIGQVFTAIKMVFRTLPPSTLPPEQEAALDGAVDMGVQTARRIAATLRPPLLDDLGLPAAVDHFLTTFSGLECRSDIADHRCLDDVTALQLFRIVQEAVTNSLRHAGATHLDITGHRREDAYELVIEDDGGGFDPQAIRPGSQGLTNIRERAALAGGSAAITSIPGDGTRIVIRIPLGSIRESP